MTNDRLFCIVVDDEPLARQVLQNYIQRVECLNTVGMYETVDEAYQTITSNTVDIIFIDLNLKAKSGLDLIRKLNSHLSNKYYIIITSASMVDEKIIKKAIQSRHVLLIDNLTKPFSFSRFYKAIRHIIPNCPEISTHD